MFKLMSNYLLKYIINDFLKLKIRKVFCKIKKEWQCVLLSSFFYIYNNYFSLALKRFQHPNMHFLKWN